MDQPIPMTPIEEKVWALIQGRDEQEDDLWGPTKASELARSTGLGERDVRDIIRCLRRNHEKPIGSRTSRPAGFFELKTKEQHDRFTKSLWRRAIDMLVTIREMRKMTPGEISRQVEIELEAADEQQAGGKAA